MKPLLPFYCSAFFQKIMSDGEREEGSLTAREQRALVRHVQQLDNNLNRNTADVNLALRGLQGQMQRQGNRIRDDLNPVPGLTPAASRELESYDGRLGVLFSDWLERFTVVAEAQGWNAERRCNVLPVYLKGAAYTAWKNMPAIDKIDYNRLRQGLLERLQPAYATRFIQKEFSARRQRTDEPVIEFAYELERLVNAGFPNLPEQNKNEFLLTNFIDKLNQQLKTLVMLFDPATFVLAREKAQQIEQNQKLAQNSVAVNSLLNPTTAVTGIEPQLLQFSAPVSVSSSGQFSGATANTQKDNAVLFEIGKITEKLERILNQSGRENVAQRELRGS